MDYHQKISEKIVLLEFIVLVYSSQNVFNMFEPYLPMRGVQVRAYDIDTYNDYQRVQEITKTWE